MTLRTALATVALALGTLALGGHGLALGASGGGQAGGEITATGFQIATASTTIAAPTLGDLSITLRYVVLAFTGSLEGTAVNQQSIVRDDVVQKKSFVTATGTFFGTLEGSEPGSFSFIVHNVIDRSACPCPPGITPSAGKFVVVEGTGSGGLEGICGGGTFVSPTALGSTYEHTYRFGKDCKANN